MFDNLKAMGAVAGLLKNKDKLRAAGERISSKLEATRVEGEAGSGAVRVTADGKLRILHVSLSPGLAGAFADASSRTMAEGLIAEAVNDALRKARDKAREAANVEARELGLPEIPPELAGLL